MIVRNVEKGIMGDLKYEFLENNSWRKGVGYYG